MTTHALVHKQPAEVDQIMDQIRNHSLQWIEQLAETGNRGDLEGLVSRLFNDIRFFKELVDQSDHGGPRPCQDIAKEIHRFMSTNLHQGLTLKALAKFLGYSEKYRSELFQMRMGQPFSQYLKRLRVDEAKRLLEIGDLSLTHIALRLGFSDQFAFSHFFKRTLGYSPTQFRKASAAGAAGLIHGADQIFHFMPVIRNGHIQQNFGRLSDLQPPDMQTDHRRRPRAMPIRRPPAPFTSRIRTQSDVDAPKPMRAQDDHLPPIYFDQRIVLRRLCCSRDPSPNMQHPVDGTSKSSVR